MLTAIFTTSAPPSSAGVPTGALGPFAGYIDFTTPLSVSASWRVPRIEGSAARYASTWIGVENTMGDFVQVGVLENCFVDPYTSIPSIVYTAFWSSDEEGFHPQILGTVPVTAGDVVDASLSAVAQGWRLTIRNSRTGEVASRTVNYPQRAFTQAEWLQEDPSDENFSQVAYPALSAIHFSNVMVNGHAPHLSRTSEDWMSARGQAWAPTSLIGDGFTIEKRTLTAEQRRWVTTLRPLRVAFLRFFEYQSLWRAHPVTTAVAERELRPLILAYAATRRAVTATSWTPIGRAALDQYFAACERYITASSALAAGEPLPTPSDVATVAATLTAWRLASLMVPARIGLP